MSEVFTPKTMVEFWTEGMNHPPGTKPQFYLYDSPNPRWVEAMDNHLPDLTSHVKNWRWPPLTQKIDLSSLVNSWIMCEFSDKEDFSLTRIGVLSEYTTDTYSCTLSCTGTPYKYCRPMFNYWHYNKIDPETGHALLDLIPAGFELEYIYDQDDLIVTFMVTGIKEGWEL